MSAFGAVVPALFWAGGLARIRPATRLPERRPLCIALLLFALALTFDVPTIYTGFDRWVGVPNLADLFEHSFGIIGVYALLLAISGLVASPAETVTTRRVRAAVPLAAVAASAVLLLAAHLPDDTIHFTERYGNRPLIAAYWAITIGYFAISLFELGALVIRHSRRTARRPLRVGLRIVGVGAGLGIVYSVTKILELVVDEQGSVGAIRRAADRLDPVLLATGAAAIGIGLLLPAVAAAWTHATRQVYNRYAVVRLRPVWLDLTATAPDVVLDARESWLHDLLGPDVSYRLYRRVIEIQDVFFARRADTVEPSATLQQSFAPAAQTRDIRRELAPLLELAKRWRDARTELLAEVAS